jgi:hypothetical protein
MNRRDPTARTAHRPSTKGDASWMRASVPITTRWSPPPTSEPREMRTTPNVPSKLRQSLIIWRYRGSKTWSGSVAPGKRTVPSGNIARRRGASDALGFTKCLYQNVQPASERHAGRRRGRRGPRSKASALLVAVGQQPESFLEDGAVMLAEKSCRAGLSNDLYSRVRSLGDLDGRSCCPAGWAGSRSTRPATVRA